MTITYIAIPETAQRLEDNHIAELLHHIVKKASVDKEYLRRKDLLVVHDESYPSTEVVRHLNGAVQSSKAIKGYEHLKDLQPDYVVGKKKPNLEDLTVVDLNYSTVRDL